MPLPCSPASMSTGDDTSTSQSHSTAGSDSDDITPRPGPSAPEQRTHANLSRPVKPTAEAFNRPWAFKEWSTDNLRERPVDSSEDDEFRKAVGKATGSPQHLQEKESPPNEDKQDIKRPVPSPLKRSEVVESAESLTHNQDTEHARQSDGEPPDHLPSPSPTPSRSCIEPSDRPSSSQSQRSKSNLKSSGTTSPLAVPGKVKRRPSETEAVRSVSFHPSSGTSPRSGPGPSPRSYSAYLMSRRTVSPHSGASRPDETESSADENTAIFRRTGSAKTGVGTTYGTATTGGDGAVEEAVFAAGGYEGAAEEEGQVSPRDRERDPGPSGPVRRRKSSISKVAGGKVAGRSASAGRQGPKQSDTDDEPDSWWRVFVDKYGSVELENKGSVARDHLALERTFLAWLRTSLSFASIGIAVTQLFRLNTTLQDNKSSKSVETAALGAHRLSQVGKPLGATFLGISILILFLGFHRYFESQHYVIRGKFPASRGSIIIVSVVAAALIVASLVTIVVVAPAAFEKR